MDILNKSQFRHFSERLWPKNYSVDSGHNNGRLQIRNCSWRGEDESIQDGKIAVLPNFVSVMCPVQKEDGLYLICVLDWKHGMNRVFLNVPSGACEEGEMMDKSASREVEEETGLKCVSIHPLNKNPIVLNGRYLNCKFVPFYAELKEAGSSKIENPDEFTKTVLIKWNDWMEFIQEGIVEASSIITTYLFMESEFWKKYSS